MSARRLVAIALVAALSVGCSAGATTGPGAAASPLTSASVSSGSPAAIPGAIVGSWVTTITEGDLRAGGVTDPGEVQENVGVFAMELGSDGTWSSTQVTPAPVRWPIFKGTLIATGPDSFRQVTTFPADFAGDSVDFTWSIKDGALVLHVQNPPDKILPIVTETHPWQPKR